MSNIPTSKQEVNIVLPNDVTKKNLDKNLTTTLPKNYLPAEGYELLGSLLKKDKELTKLLYSLLLASRVETDTTGNGEYILSPIPNRQPMFNRDGTDNIITILLVHLSTPLSYLQQGQSPVRHAEEVSKQLILDIAANFQRWDLKNPSLIPQLAGIFFRFILSSEGQSDSLIKDTTQSGMFNRSQDMQNKEAERPKTNLFKQRRY